MTDASESTDASEGGWAILPDASVVLTLYSFRPSPPDVSDGKHREKKLGRSQSWSRDRVGGPAEGQMRG